jgi:hypothetical protein
MYIVVVEIADHARKHGISDEDILHAARNAFGRIPHDAGDQVFLIGADTTGRLLQIIVIDPDSDHPAVIHANILQAKFHRYL